MRDFENEWFYNPKYIQNMYVIHVCYCKYNVPYLHNIYFTIEILPTLSQYFFLNKRQQENIKIRGVL